MSGSAKVASPGAPSAPGVDLAATCVVVRMFNESAVVESVIRELRRTFPTVIAIDDGSEDGTAELARRSGALVATHPINLGAGAALQTGLEVALCMPGIEYIVTFDADGQHRVQDAIAMVRAAQESGADVLLGSRFLDGTADVPRTRRMLLRAATLFTRATTGLYVTDAHCGLRVFTRGAAETIRLRLPGMAYASELMQLIKEQHLALLEHPVRVRYTDYSRSKGQRNINAVNIAFDLMMRNLREPA